MPNNVDHEVAAGFGDEWSRFDQTGLSAPEKLHIFNEYFRVFPHSALNAEPAGADFGVGSGRWEGLVAS